MPIEWRQDSAISGTAERVRHLRCIWRCAAFSAGTWGAGGMRQCPGRAALLLLLLLLLRQGLRLPSPQQPDATKRSSQQPHDPGEQQR